MSEQTALRVLLVEDEPQDAEIFRRYAADSTLYRNEVDHVTTGEEAMRRLSESDYDLVFLDHRLGGAETGLGVLKRIMPERPDTPVIILTGAGDEELAVQTMKAGAADYLLKDTFNGEMLERSMRHALEKQRLTIERRRLEREAQEAERLRSIRQLAAGAAHNYNNLLSGIKGINDGFCGNTYREGEDKEQVGAARPPHSAVRGARPGFPRRRGGADRRAEGSGQKCNKPDEPGRTSGG